MLGPSWDGWDGMNCGLPFVPPNYPHKARSPVSQLLGEIVHFLLLGGTGLFFSMGFLFHWQLPRPAGEAAWDVLCVGMNLPVVPADNGMCWAVPPGQRGSSRCCRHPAVLWGLLSCHLEITEWFRVGRDLKALFIPTLLLFFDPFLQWPLSTCVKIATSKPSL